MAGCVRAPMPGPGVMSLLLSMSCRGNMCLSSSSLHATHRQHNTPKYAGSKGCTRSDHLDAVLRPEPHFRDVFFLVPRDDDGDKEDERYCGGWASEKTRITPKWAWRWCSRKSTNMRNTCHSCAVRPHGPEPGGSPGPGGGETGGSIDRRGLILTVQVFQFLSFK
ncbi:hypothetical protein EDB87DRAFT_636153 [Lactarius vividus]|nr:hypothetical protein EDB87DRAFT_636153 [Lactarius vividus]